MWYLDRTFLTPEENLACDEALLDACETDPAQETLRFWEPRQHFIVLGFSDPLYASVDLPGCLRREIPVLRRISGGGTVLQGPGCLNFSLSLRIDRSPVFQSIRGAHCAILKRHMAALSPLLGPTLTHEGDTDLARGGLKFSGNAQRRRQNALLFHGTFLLNLDLSLLEGLLPLPRRQPAYRDQRSHKAFLTNLQIPADAIRQTLRQAWGAARLYTGTPGLDEVLPRYRSKAWTTKF